MVNMALSALTPAKVRNWPPAEPSALLTVDQTCRVLGVSRATLYRLFRDGQLQSVSIYSSPRVTRSEVERFLKALPAHQF